MSEINVKDLNYRISADPVGLVTESEAHYRALVAGVAARIAADGKIRIVLLAGPSGSGKTTTANLIADALRHRGKPAAVISLDNFYRSSDDPAYPRFENGERNCEAIDALDLPELIAALSAIARGEGFVVPRFDFKTGARGAPTRHEPMGGGVVIIEGLHALNPRVFSLLPAERLFKIFISVSTNVVRDGERILSGRKIRFLRRMVRDSIYRGADAERTLSMWMNVLRGEDIYLYPYRDNADVAFDSFHPFELSVMRPLAEKLISEGLAAKDGYAKTVKLALNSVLPLPKELVPDDSLIREFISGGIYESLY